MLCDCGGYTEVKDSRLTGKNTIRRRRYCKVCSERFTTYEIHEDDMKREELNLMCIEMGIREVISNAKERLQEKQNAKNL